MNKFVFDVDGTLTPSRGKINPDFEAFFHKFASENDVYLITGSDKDKTVEQIGDKLFKDVKGVYNCSGNDIWVHGNNVKTSEWKLPEECIKWLIKELNESEFPLRTGNHLEHRPGAANFSIVGRNCTLGERMLYVKYDNKTNERINIANMFNYIFGEESLGIIAKVGGETGLDIFPIGSDKSQMMHDFNDNDKVIFFGDRMEPGGNDEPLAKVNTNGTNHHVRDWNHTWELLKGYA